MKRPLAAVWQIPGRLIFVLLCSFRITCAAAVTIPAIESLPATNVAEFSRRITPAAGSVCAFDLRGTVLAANADSGALLLQDDSGSVVLQLNFQGTKLQPGQTIRLTGTNFVSETDYGLALGTVPVVDNDGVHSVKETEGTVRLEAGKHPIRVNYFNRAVTAQLDVSCSGPGLARQAIPSDTLWPAGTIQGEAAGASRGLSYRCFEGDWNALPDFDRLTPGKAGVVSHFDVGVRSRPEYVAIQFEGFLDIPRAGSYTFYLNSDDGSQLFLDFAPPEITVLGPGALPKPVSITPGQPLLSGANLLWAEVEGTVTSLKKSAHGVVMDVASEGNELRVMLIDSPAQIPSYLQGCRVRIQGVCSEVRNPRGQLCAGLLVGCDWRSVRVLEIPPENLAIETRTVSEIKAAVTTGERSGIVHLKGELHADPSRQTASFKDETGFLPIQFLNGDAVEFDTAIECLGRWNTVGTNILLQQAISFEASDDGRDDAAPAVLRTALEVQQLKPDQAERRIPVELEGVVTWVLNWQSSSFVIQDATRAVYVSVDGLLPPGQRNIGGSYCRLRGFTLPGEFSPIVELEDLTVLGRGQLPSPVKPTRDQLLNGSLDAQYVELRGMLILVHDSYVTLLTAEGTFDVNIAPEPKESWNHLVGAILRVRGCFFADWEKQTGRIILDHPVLRLWAANMSVESQRPADLFQARRVPGKELMRFDAKLDPFQWVKVSGQIIYGGPLVYYLMDGSTGLRVRLARATPFEPGDLIEVVGLVELSGASPLLREAVARKIGTAPLPEPRYLSLDSPDGQYDSTRVWTEGSLVEVKDRGAAEDLEIQVGVKRFIARLTSPKRPAHRWEIGSRLRLTGMFHALNDNRANDGGVSSFELRLNSPNDVQVLARPSWWTLGRVLTIAAVLVVGLALASVWIALLRRQVERRTVELRHEIGQREQAEKLRALEQERTRIARDLHDDLGSELTEIGMLASAGSNLEIEPQAAAKRLRGIAEKSWSMISALDGVVWVVNAKNDTLSSLIEYLASNAEEFLAMAEVRCRVEMPAQTPDRKLPAEVRHDVLLAVREAFNNAVRHGRPSQVRLRFILSKDNLEILVQDDGRGFEMATVSPGNGLGNIQERMRRVGGSCRIESAPERGTSITLKLPLLNCA
jgi:signal transduction histidine kinase